MSTIINEVRDALLEFPEGITRDDLLLLLSPSITKTQLGVALYGLAKYRAINEEVLGAPIFSTPERDTRIHNVKQMRRKTSRAGQKLGPRKQKSIVRPRVGQKRTPEEARAFETQSAAFLAYWHPWNPYELFGAQQ
jgi:hypothetical protein